MLQDMLSASQPDLETFLTQVYRAIAGAAPLKDKVMAASPGYHHCVLKRNVKAQLLFSMVSHDVQHDALDTGL